MCGEPTLAKWHTICHISRDCRARDGWGRAARGAFSGAPPDAFPRLRMSVERRRRAGFGWSVRPSCNNTLLLACDYEQARRASRVEPSTEREGGLFNAGGMGRVGRPLQLASRRLRPDGDPGPQDHLDQYPALRRQRRRHRAGLSCAAAPAAGLGHHPRRRRRRRPARRLHGRSAIRARNSGAQARRRPAPALDRHQAPRPGGSQRGLRQQLRHALGRRAHGGDRRHRDEPRQRARHRRRGKGASLADRLRTARSQSR